jgi:large subunit ribosomal protein L23
MNPFTSIQRLRLTEKASANQEKHNTYVFVVSPDVNKIQIRQAVEQLYPNVTVTRVNTMNYSGKMRRQHTKQRGRTSNWKKAVVTLKEGDKIDIGV